MGMKLGIETEGLCGTIRGVGYFTLTLIEALKNEGIVCYHSPNATDLHFPKVAHHHFRKKLRIPFSKSLSALCHLRCFNDLDLMHFPEPKILYGKKPKAPFVLTIHDVMPLLFPHLFPKKSYCIMSYFLPRYLNEAAAIAAVSQQTRDDLVRLFPKIENKVTVIPCALLPRERTIDEEKEPFLFYIGSFEPRKNLKGIIEAFGIIKKRGYPHRLILAGKEEGTNCLPTIPRGVQNCEFGPTRKLSRFNCCSEGSIDLIQPSEQQLNPEALARSKSTILDAAGYNLSDDIILTGYISEAEKARLFQKASVLVWPSLYEGFGIPLLEAMASGTPIVTSNGSAPKEIVGEAALCVDPKDPLEIADAIEKILSSRELSKELMQKGINRAQDFSLDQFRMKHLKLYSTLMEKK